MTTLNIDGFRQIQFRPGDMAVQNCKEAGKKPYTMKGRMLGRIKKEIELLFIIGDNVDMVLNEMVKYVEFPRTTVQCYLKSLVNSGLLDITITAHSKSNTYTRVKKMKNRRPILSQEFNSYVDTYYSNEEKSKKHAISFIQLIK